MVQQRDSISKVGLTLAQLVLSGGGTGGKATELAAKLEALCTGKGRYEKRYNSPEERVLHRHLNLYRNKLAKAKTDADRERWRTKLSEQRAKIARFEAGAPADLDLDGL